MKKNENGGTIFIEGVKVERARMALIGLTPLILNRMSEKSKGELLLPAGRKTSAEKQSSLKHDPLAEYRASAYTIPEGDALLGVMSSAIKGAMMTAALDLPGAKKAQIGRLVYVYGDYTPIFGVPKLFMSVTRSADMNKTPDIRTRAIVPEWVALITLSYVVPMLNATSIGNLISAAGITAGIGDWRPEKGKGTYGQFRVSNIDDPEFKRIVKIGGRKAQEMALENPGLYNEDTERLFSWYNVEVVKRGKKK
jgi:hypothetical protein